MNTIVQPLCGTLLARLARSFTEALAAGVRSIRQRRRRRAARLEFQQLDARTLADLGVSRGEFDSCWAESHGLIEATRLRIARAAPFGERL
jgi:uncharacterized protein YjiS (DUF1127 family)